MAHGGWVPFVPLDLGWSLGDHCHLFTCDNIKKKQSVQERQSIKQTKLQGVKQQQQLKNKKSPGHGILKLPVILKRSNAHLKWSQNFFTN